MRRESRVGVGLALVYWFLVILLLMVVDRVAHAAPRPSSYQLAIGIYHATGPVDPVPHRYEYVVRVGGFRSWKACVREAEAAQARFNATQKGELAPASMDVDCLGVWTSERAPAPRSR